MTLKAEKIRFTIPAHATPGDHPEHGHRPLYFGVSRDEWQNLVVKGYQPWSYYFKMTSCGPL